MYFLYASNAVSGLHSCYVSSKVVICSKCCKMVVKIVIFLFEMPIFQALEIFSSDVAMTYKKYFYHCSFSSFIALIYRVLRGL